MKLKHHSTDLGLLQPAMSWAVAEFGMNWPMPALESSCVGTGGEGGPRRLAQSEACMQPNGNARRTNSRAAGSSVDPSWPLAVWRGSGGQAMPRSLPCAVSPWLTSSWPAAPRTLPRCCGAT